MSDRNLRELERRWRESGSDHDEAHYLKAQVRAGELDQEALERAAHLGNPAALLASGQEAKEVRWFKTRHRIRWGKTIAEWGDEFMQRAALADARRHLRRLAELETSGTSSDPEHLQACRALLQASCDLAVGRLLGNAENRLLPMAPLRYPQEEAAQTAFTRGSTAAGAAHDDARWWWDWVLEQHGEEFPQLRQVIQADLSPWILGRCDPLRLDLSQLRIASPCEVAWESMQGDDRARHCGACDRTVYDLSALTRPEAEDLVRRHEGDVCVQFYQRADGTKLTTDCPVGLSARLAPYEQRMLRGMIA